MASAVLPLFHLLGDPPDDKAFDFIHIEPLVSRSSLHHWVIPAHRHRDLVFRSSWIEQGGGETADEASILTFEAPCALLHPADDRAWLPLARERDGRLGGELRPKT